MPDLPRDHCNTERPAPVAAAESPADLAPAVHAPAVLAAALDGLAQTATELSLDAGTLQDQRAVRDALDRLRAAALDTRP